MIRRCFFLTERQIEAFDRISQTANAKSAEILRRMIDHCLEERVLNGIVPSCSGKMVEKTRKESE